MDPQVRRIAATEGTRWREVRLLALQSDPLAFGNTYERAAARAESDWLSSAREHADGDDRAAFFAIVGEQVVGLVVAHRDQDRPDAFSVYQMWVAPEARGRGTGARLLTVLEAWVRERGGTILGLMVSDTAPNARRLYERAGFLPDPRCEASPHPGVIDRGMTKRL